MLDRLIDPGALGVVLIGTLLATVARCGWDDMRAAARALGTLAKRGFDPATNRAALARAASEIRARGSLCADTPDPPDRSLGALVDTYVRTGSLDALHSLSRSQRATREVVAARAARALESAGDLAPVFGLVGTLYAITQLAPAVSDNPAEATMGAIATAVLSSLYGVLTAHLVFLPLARAIERASEGEEQERAKLLDWFESELTARPAKRRKASTTPPALRDVA